MTVVRAQSGVAMRGSYKMKLTARNTAEALIKTTSKFW